MASSHTAPSNRRTGARSYESSESEDDRDERLMQTLKLENNDVDVYKYRLENYNKEIEAPIKNIFRFMEPAPRYPLTMSDFFITVKYREKVYLRFVVNNVGDFETTVVYKNRKYFTRNIEDSGCSRDVGHFIINWMDIVNIKTSTGLTMVEITDFFYDFVGLTSFDMVVEVEEVPLTGRLPVLKGMGLLVKYKKQQGWIDRENENDDESSSEEEESGDSNMDDFNMDGPG
jgi:hypothetical protein